MSGRCGRGGGGRLEWTKWTREERSKEMLNSSHKPKIQCCDLCGAATEKCEEDALQFGDRNPLCESCFDFLEENGKKMDKIRETKAMLAKREAEG